MQTSFSLAQLAMRRDQQRAVDFRQQSVCERSLPVGARQADGACEQHSPLVHQREVRLGAQQV